MKPMHVSLRWGWVLGVALFAPVALPAGGGERRQPQIRRREVSAPLLTQTSFGLLASPLAIAPSLKRLEVGTPVHILRNWEATDGQQWVHIQIASFEAFSLTSSVRRGWVNV